ncbi:LPS export ABC transporter periplasmic protein LptC [bacterium]|nr:MAG: LPS export ABC transporter periplasmic protein LptC [bacterium]
MIRRRMTLSNLPTLWKIFIPVLMIALYSVPAFCLPAEVQISGFTVSEKGREGYWKIQAAEATYSNDMEAVLKDVHARLLEGDREKVSVMGNKGRYFSDKSLLVLEGNVEIQTNTGYRLTAPRMEWNSKESTIRSQGGVELTGTWLLVRGQTLNYSIESSIAVITGEVRTRWTIGAGGL